jgi:hypothetical protein
MSVDVTLSWNGDIVSRDIAKKIDIAILQAAILVQGRAVTNARVDTGNLQRSINYSTKLKQNIFTDDEGTVSHSERANKGEGFVGSVVKYANRQNNLNGFLTRAFTTSRKDIESLLKMIIGQSGFVK